MSSRDCCTGFLETGKPEGHYESYAGQECYISKPKKNDLKIAVVIGSDIFGYKLNNVQLMADRFAELGYLAIVPDLFENKAFKAELVDPLLGTGLRLSNTIFSFIMNFFARLTAALYFFPFIPFFIMKHPPESKILKFVKIFEQLRQDKYKIGFQGYCFGGTIGMMLSGTHLVDAISCAHPGPFDIKESLDQIKTKTLLILVKNDMHIKDTEQSQILEFSRGQPILEAALFFQHHGFAIRCDTRIEEQKKEKERAFNLAVSFFQKNIK
jgi:dienelactone hydrolase